MLISSLEPELARKAELSPLMSRTSLLLPQLHLLLLRRHRHRRLPLRLLRLLRRSCAREGGRPGQLR